MLENQNEIKKLISSLIRYFDQEQKGAIVDFLKKSYPSSEEVGFDNWNGGTYTYNLIFEVEIDVFTHYQVLLESFAEEIMDVIKLFIYGTEQEYFGKIVIRPILKQYLEWNSLTGIANKNSVLTAIEHIKAVMVAVATGGPRIQDVNDEYISAYIELDNWLKLLGIQNPNPYKNLWEWYGRWSQSDLSKYASRRAFIPAIFQSTIDIIMESSETENIDEYEPTGWDRVDRTVYEMKKRFDTAVNEEQFQAIGMLGRETIITIAQQVYNKEIHHTEDGVDPSETDAKRMLDAYLSCELSGASNERIRKYAKASLDMSNNLTHNRMATKRDASMCIVSVTSLANLVKIVDENSNNLLTI